jgi:beta-lactamase class A
MVLMSRIAGGEAVSRAASQAMLAILSGQRIRDAIPAMLPPGLVVAHKPGDIDKVHHDAGIVLGPRPFVIVVLVRGIADRSTSAALIARIASDAWNEISKGVTSSARP